MRHAETWVQKTNEIDEQGTGKGIRGGTHHQGVQNNKKNSSTQQIEVGGKEKQFGPLDGVTV